MTFEERERMLTEAQVNHLRTTDDLNRMKMDLDRERLERERADYEITETRRKESLERERAREAREARRAEAMEVQLQAYLRDVESLLAWRTADIASSERQAAALESIAKSLRAQAGHQD